MFNNNRTCREVSRARIRAGLTLVETIAVFATLTFATSIILPSLSRAREGGNSSTCLNNLKLFGQAIQQYVADNGGYLPGPGIITVPYQSGRYFNSTSSPTMGDAWYRVQMTSYLQPYLNVNRAGGKLADELAFCPTADGIECAGATDSMPWYYKPRSYYLCNSLSSTTSPKNTSGRLPYHGTTPKYYFGYTYLSTNPYNVPADQMPKRLDAIANASREWAMADLWYAVVAHPRESAQLAGTWPYFYYIDGTGGFLSINGQLRIPSYAFHQTTKTYTSAFPPSVSPTDPRITTGRTNAVFFDAHAASVRPWVGTVNPCLTSSCGN